MKNIHVLPTDNKWSRLYFNINDREYQICQNEKTSTVLKPNRHIYITNSEEIKEGDWVKNITIPLEKPFKLDKDGILYTQLAPCEFRKIILTDNKDLIKDGVQAIDDKFLEWFVKNPSCEEVEVTTIADLDLYYKNGIGGQKYKITIPKEEPKQELPQFGTK